MISNSVSMVSSVITAVVVMLSTWRKTTTDVWRDEAEAQRLRADRLETDLAEIKDRLARIERENERLLQILTALDPERIASIHIN